MILGDTWWGFFWGKYHTEDSVYQPIKALVILGDTFFHTFYEELQLYLNQIECKRMIFHSPYRPQNIIFALKDIDKRIKPQNVTSKQ